MEPRPEASLSLARTRVRAGERVRYTVVNLGSCTLSLGEDYRVERSVDGQRLEVRRDNDVEDIGWDLPPAGSKELTMVVPRSAKAGRYRLVQPTGERLEDSPPPRMVEAGFEVIP